MVLHIDGLHRTVGCDLHNSSTMTQMYITQTHVDELEYDKTSMCYFFRYEEEDSFMMVTTMYGPTCDIHLDESYSDPSEIYAILIHVSIVR